MDKEQLLEHLARKPLILDGATGTEMIKRGMPSGVSPELWALENPAVIREIGEAYFQAGSDIVYIPSFGANKLKLAEFGLDGRAAEINSALAAVAKEHAAGRYLVFGDMSPTGQFAEPYGDLTFDDLKEVYFEQAGALFAGGADGIVVETVFELTEARAALAGAKAAAKNGEVVFVTMTFNATGHTLFGNSAADALVALQDAGADAFGCNCSTGPEEMAPTISKLKDIARIPLIAKPNAGMPQQIGGETVFPMDAGAFAAFAHMLADSGAVIFGGCCGTTPEHIAALNRELKN